MLEIDNTTVFTLSDSIVMQALPELEQFYAFNVENGDHYNLNNAAYFILGKISRGATFKSLLQDFLTEYNIDKKTAHNDIEEILGFSLDNNLISIKENES